MPWCPKCRSEYRPGFTICADCGSELVDELPSKSAKNDFEGETLEDYLMQRVEESGSSESMREALKDPRLQESVLNMVKTLREEDRPQRAPMTVYQDSAEKASDNKSSAWMLLILGIAGLTFLALCATKVIPIEFGNPYLFYGVMGAIFVLFLVGGFVSMKNAKVFEVKAKSENTLKNTLLDWSKENFTAQEIDAAVKAADDTEEVLYFKRISYIKAKLNHQFVNLNQGFLDRLIDDCLYEDIFEENAE